MTKLILSTGNIVSGGPTIIRKPGAFRSNLELTNSLRSNFLAAQQDFAEDHHHYHHDFHPPTVPAAGAAPIRNGNGTTTNGTTTTTTTTNGHDRPRRTPLSLWTERDGPVLYVPRVPWSAAGLQEEPGQYDVTMKLFFLPGAPVQERARYVMEALALVQRELGITTVDLLIASFPGMSFEGDCEWEADRRNAQQGNLEEEVATWAVLEELQRRGLARGLGIAEFGSDKLEKFIKMVGIKPVVDQINVRDCCKVPPPLSKLAKDEGIELYVHTDCTDILPRGTVRDLLGHGPQGAGVLADAEHGGEGLKGDVVPQWVVKYTAFVKNRGVIEKKGYFAGAQIIEW